MTGAAPGGTDQPTDGSVVAEMAVHRIIEQQAAAHGDVADVTWPRGLSIMEKVEDDEARYVPIDLSAALDRPCQSCPNLPILTRESDVACVIPDRDGVPPLLVPHSTIAALQAEAVPRFARWAGEPGALDLWMALMTGATVSITAESMQTAAA